MHKVKTQRSGQLFVKNMHIFKFFYMVIIKNYKVKKIILFNKFPEISGKIGINFPSCVITAIPKLISQRKIMTTHSYFLDIVCHRGKQHGERSSVYTHAAE